MKGTFTKFILLETLILVAAVILLGITAFSYRHREIDVVRVNDYVQTVKEQWQDGSFDGTKLSQAQLMILGADGSVLYCSGERIFDGITSELDAIRKNMYCISVTDNVPSPIYSSSHTLSKSSSLVTTQPLCSRR